MDKRTEVILLKVISEVMDDADRLKLEAETKKIVSNIVRLRKLQYELNWYRREKDNLK